jgi:hypothetical protein
LIGSTIGTAVVASSVNALFGRQMQAALTPTTDPRIVEAFHNPQAVIDPTMQAELQKLLVELGPAATAQVQQLTQIAQAALIEGVRLGYVMALVLAVAILGLVLFIRTPNFRAAQPRAEMPKAENAVEIA